MITQTQCRSLRHFNTQPQLRAMKDGASDRFGTNALTLAMVVPLFGFIFAMKGRIPITLPGMPETGWVGVILGASGFALRLWSLLVLRERFTRTFRGIFADRRL